MSKLKMRSNNIWIICHYAQQPPYNTMLRYHNWGKELIKRGCRVTILAASTVHNTDIDVEKKIGSPEVICEGIQYYYIKTPKYSGNGRKRMENMLTFCFGLSKYAKKKLKPDIIITCEAYTYPFVKHYFKKVPIITDTVDLWPESIIEYADFSKKNPIIKILYRLERMAYLKSEALIFSMEGGRDYLQEQKYASEINFQKVFHINMGCDLNEYDKNREFLQETLEWDIKKINIVYCGSIRQANQVKQICDAAEELLNRGIKNVAIQIYGNGDELEILKRYIKEKNIYNVKFYGRIEKEKIPYILSNATANILTYKQVRLMKYGGSQSKLFDYLASGRPIICNAKFGYNLITRHDCGLVTENQTPEAFADTIQEFCNMSGKRLAEMGRNSRKTAETYDQPILANKLCEVIHYVERNKL